MSATVTSAKIKMKNSNGSSVSRSLTGATNSSQNKYSLRTTDPSSVITLVKAFLPIQTEMPVLDNDEVVVEMTQSWQIRIPVDDIGAIPVGIDDWANIIDEKLVTNVVDSDVDHYSLKTEKAASAIGNLGITGEPVAVDPDATFAGYVKGYAAALVDQGAIVHISKGTEHNISEWVDVSLTGTQASLMAENE